MPPNRGRRPSGVEPPEPWRSFLREVDARLQAPLELHCLGGFVVAQHYGTGRDTADIDFLAAIAHSPQDDAERLAGRGSELHRRHGLYV
ncbi:MAG: hypothetical protein JSR54_12115 [Proteobacteria bacterium]|nr:hypothetical protein [Pseudomonadota bacterium]